MKVVHVLKKIETIDEDVKDLKKLEKSIAQDKSFTTAIYMSIEKQINILLGERIKLLELKIENPPENFVEEIEGKSTEKSEIDKPKKTAKKSEKNKTANKSMTIKSIDDIPMLTQDQIDAKISSITVTKEVKKEEKQSEDDISLKILDTALEHGTLNKKELEKSRDKKVKFFRENFPAE